MSYEGRSGGMSIGDAIGMGVILFAIVIFFIVVAIVTFLASPGMAVVGVAKLVFGLAHSGRQVWVLSIAMSLAILIVLVFALRDVAKGVSAYFLLCCVTMVMWSVLTYGFESRATEKLAAVFFPGFTINGAPAPAEPPEKLAKRGPAVSEPREEPERSTPDADSPRLGERLQVAPHAVPPTQPAPLVVPTPTPLPLATFRVALQLPLKRAYVMVRLNDREVFRCDFRPGKQDGTPGLVTPPIEAVAGSAVLKVWVISQDKREADEYVVLPVELRAGEDRRLSLVLDPARELKGRLVAEGEAEVVYRRKTHHGSERHHAGS